MDLGLRDRAVLVTGGTRGIGRAIAKAYAGEGARVAITYANDEGAAKTVVRDIEESVRQRTPSRRLSVPDDIAAAVLLLGSPANGNVTGAYLPVAGGID